MLRARSYAMLGRAGEAAEALLQAADARGTGAHDELHDEIAGEFAFRPAKQHYYAAVTHLHLGRSARRRSRRRAGRWPSTPPRAGRTAPTGASPWPARIWRSPISWRTIPAGPRRPWRRLLALPPDRRIEQPGVRPSAPAAAALLPAGGEPLARQIERFCSVGLPQPAARRTARRERTMTVAARVASAPGHALLRGLPGGRAGHQEVSRCCATSPTSSTTCRPRVWWYGWRRRPRPASYDRLVDLGPGHAVARRAGFSHHQAAGRPAAGRRGGVPGDLLAPRGAHRAARPTPRSWAAAAAAARRCRRCRSTCRPTTRSGRCGGPIDGRLSLDER